MKWLCISQSELRKYTASLLVCWLRCVHAALWPILVVLQYLCFASIASILDCLETLQKLLSSLLNIIKQDPSYGSMGSSVQLKSHLLWFPCFKLVPWGTLVLRISVFAPFTPYIQSNYMFVFDYESWKFSCFVFNVLILINWIWLF